MYNKTHMDNKEYRKQYYLKNKEKRAKLDKEYYEKNKSKRQQQGIQYYKENREEILEKKQKDSSRKEYAKTYYQNNKEQRLEYTKAYKSKPESKERQCYLKKVKKQKDINFRLHENLRSRLSNALKGRVKNTTIEELGCSIEEFKLHLEKQFDKNMNWGNYGTYWEIDHIQPLSKGGSFHYTNTQPMHFSENRSKGNRV
jgi:5-methylcytosine-specific restriction endonuclease McrA